jgi:DNA replication protein DnaC
MARADCPKCGGTGWRTVESPANQAQSTSADRAGARRGAAIREAVLCDCAAEDRSTRLVERARIPRRYEHCDFSNFETDVPHDDARAAAWNHSLAQAKIEVQGFARDYPVAGEGGLLLMGPWGVGKTHLAVAALKEIVARGHSGLFYDYRELLKQIQASYNPASQTAEMEVLEPVLQVELLLLDDLGSSKPSAWALETVGHILNTRYNEKRVTLITTSYLDAPMDGGEASRDTFAAKRTLRMPSGQAIGEHGKENLAQRVGERIRSRLYEMCRTVAINAPDYRKEIRQAGGLRP